MAEAKPTRIIDVAHPGQSAPAANSKSVIVSRRPLLKDPMVVDKPDGEVEPKPDKKLPGQQPEEPVHATDPILPPTAKAETKPTLPAKEPPKLEPSRETDPDEAAPTEQDQAPEDPKAAEAAEAEASQRQAAVDKLTDTKQYYLPINSVEKRRTKRFVTLGVVLSVLLALAWVNIALDAGLIQLGSVKPVTHFFSN